MSNEEFGGAFIAKLIPVIAFIAVVLSRNARRNKYNQTRSGKTGTGSKNIPNLRGSSVPTMTTSSTAQTSATRTSATVTMPTGTTSVGPKPWQTGKHNVTKKKTYKSAFENKGLSSSGTISAFGDSKDEISSGSMAASNAAYMDVGNDYMSSFEVGGHRKTPVGFDR